MFHPELPAELALLILLYLPVSSIGRLRRVNHDWAYFVKQNSVTVYRNAAFQEGFIGKNQTLLSDFDGTRTGKPVASGTGPVRYEDDKGLYSLKALRGVNSWETLCKRQKLIHRSWLGHAPSRILSSPRILPSPLPLNTLENSHYRRVHRIKVDEQVGITLATTELGGLVVRDIDTDEVLWELPIWYVHSHAHLEYERGYVIFDRTDGGKEVWRRTQDVEADEARRNLRRSSHSHSQSPGATLPEPSASGTNEGVQDEESGDGEEELPRPQPDQRQLHVASYLRTLALTFAAAAASPTHTKSAPSSPSSSSSSSYPPPSTPSPIMKRHPSSAHPLPSRTLKAHFTPFAVLHLPAPEASRAFRFVYPHLLVAAMDRAYVFDVPRGRVVQVVEEVQRVRRVRVPEEEEGVDGGNERGMQEGRGMGMGGDGGASAGTTPRAGTPAHSTSTPHDPEQDENEDESEEDEDDPDASLAQFLGQIRYVEISSRHVFVAGRHVLRVFSRETGRCVMNVSSTRARYGAWAWCVGGGGRTGAGAGVGRVGESARAGSRAPVSADGKRKGKQKAGEEEKEVLDALDTYDAARVEGRETVRVPLEFRFQNEMRDGNDDKMVIDQFVAVHASRDGKHFVALLSGARLIVVHHFEALLARHRVLPPVRRHPPHRPNLSLGNLLDRQLRLMNRAMKMDIQREAQGARDRDLFMHTMDIRLGSPRVTDSVYLAYEHGRIGVVTSNAVYIVTPTPPPPPVPRSSLGQNMNLFSPPRMMYPYPPPPPVHVTRLPYFVNPSWLGAVTCLMMSDTGLYLNWNPTMPVSSTQRNRDGFGFGAVFGPLGGLTALGGGGPHFGMADEGDEDEDEDEELEDHPEELDEDEWTHEGDSWDEVDGGGDGELEGDWDYHQPSANEEAEHVPDTTMQDGAHDAEGGDAIHPSLSFPPTAAYSHLQSDDEAYQHAAGEMANGFLAVKPPSEHERDGILSDTHRAAGEDGGGAGRDEENRLIWEAEYHRDLRDIDMPDENDWYQELPNGDMFVAPNPRPIEVSEVSTVFAVEFVPEL